ncbi:hypothetical protein PROFUN_04619 [Planoprotostelium fungivorum]|uniref:Synaptobrevin domain-containing protein n=1 Tax=Planoprotostelium fungivorum TaxID=1890364 RepID=A0A2P6NUE4_9EUKA|nr:hypothetical protein PROFUN_04619 [Planoprotostelium fungivorum]
MMLARCFSRFFAFPTSEQQQPIMPIDGTLIARGTTILALWVSPGSNFVEVAKRLLTQISSETDTKKSYAHQGFMFHFVVERGIIYMCMSDSNTGFKGPYTLLYDLISKVKANYPQEVYSANEIPPLSRIIKEQTSFYNDSTLSDKTGKLRSQVNDVKNVMIENVDKVLARGEKIETLVDKTQELQDSATTFQFKSREVKNKFWWKNLKMKICIGITILIIVLLVVLLLLWKTGVFDNLGKGGNNNNGGGATTTSSQATHASTSFTSSTTFITAPTVAPPPTS